MGAATSRKTWILTLLRVTAQLPSAFSQCFGDKAKKRIVLPRVTIPVTTRCTLCCDKCLAHIPDLKNHRDIPIDDLIQDISALLSCVDHIYVVELSGGEAFLHPNLDEVIQACLDTGKVGHISVLSNGTVIPGAETLAALREAKATVQISKYSCVPTSKAEALKRVLEENEISYVHAGVRSWHDMGRFAQLQAGSAKRRFSLCILTLCFVYFKGKLHRCSGKAAILSEEGCLPDCEGDYIDLREIHPRGFPEALKKLLKKHVTSACSYCLGGTYKSPEIPVAAQRQSRESDIQRRDMP